MIVPEPVPELGALTRNAVYRRMDLADRFGGTRYKGIIPSSREPVVLLFHTEERTRKYYQDGIDEDGIYWYSGMGERGNMNWNFENKAIQDHFASGRDLLFFERAQRKDGLWRYAGEMMCVTHRMEQRPDFAGMLREAIMFGLVPLVGDNALGTGPDQEELTNQNLQELRESAMQNPNSGSKEQFRLIYRRTRAVRQYALMRSKGKCEACGRPAPFTTAKGTPFLEVHHLTRLADSGPDFPDKVAAVCPNCHRRCHYSIDAAEYNQQLQRAITAIEASI